MTLSVSCRLLIQWTSQIVLHFFQYFCLCINEEKDYILSYRISVIFYMSFAIWKWCFHPHFSLTVPAAGKSEELLETSECYDPAEPTGQKLVVDPSGNPLKAAIPSGSQWDCKKRGDSCAEDTSEFPHGLPADLEEQRKFLTEQCISSFCLCLSRFPQHYKSLYRLAYLYTYSKTHKVSSDRVPFISFTCFSNCWQITVLTW